MSVLHGRVVWWATATRQVSGWCCAMATLPASLLPGIAGEITGYAVYYNKNSLQFLMIEFLRFKVLLCHCRQSRLC